MRKRNLPVPSVTRHLHKTIFEETWKDPHWWELIFLLQVRQDIYLKNDLRRHKCIHMGENLKTHERIHLGEKRCACSKCDEGLNIHQLENTWKDSQTGDMPFTCTNCGKTFTRKEIWKDMKGCTQKNPVEKRHLTFRWCGSMSGPKNGPRRRYPSLLEKIPILAEFVPWHLKSFVLNWKSLIFSQLEKYTFIHG